MSLTEDSVSWTSLTTESHNLQFLLSDIVDLQKTPDTQPNARVRILLSKDKASNTPLVFDFVSGSGLPNKQAREKFIGLRNELKKTALASAPGLAQVFASVVHRDGLSEAEFWRMHQQLLVDAGLSRRQPALGSVAPDLDGRIKRHLDPATLTKICKLEPAVYEAFKKFVPIPLDRTAFWTAYYEAREHRFKRGEEDTVRRLQPGARGTSGSIPPGTSAGAGVSSSSTLQPQAVADLKSPAEFFDAYKRGLFKQYQVLSSDGPAGASRNRILANAESAGLDNALSGVSAGDAGYGIGAMPYEVDTLTLRAIPVPGASTQQLREARVAAPAQLEGYGRASWAASRVIEDTNRYSSLVLNDTAVAAPSRNAVDVRGAPAQLTADLDSELRAEPDPVAGLATLSTDLSGLRAVLSEEHSAIDMSVGAERVHDPLRQPPPSTDFCDVNVVRAARTALSETTCAAHDLFEARKRGAMGFPAVVPPRWRRWISNHFSTFQELLPHLWATLSVPTTRMDESTRERRNRILERLSETRTYLERVRSVIVDKGAVGVAPPPLTSWGSATQQNSSAAMDDDEVEDVTGGPDVALAAKNELLRLIKMLQDTIAPSIQKAEEARAGLALQTSRWRPL